MEHFMAWTWFDLGLVAAGFVGGYFWNDKVWPWIKRRVGSWANKPG